MAVDNVTIKKVIGPVTAYAIAVAGGYQGTQQQWEAEIANASNNASAANTNALKAEGYALGKQNGVDVQSGSSYFENNAKYYSEHAEAAVEHYPRIGQNGNWEVWDALNEVWTDTEIAAQGPAGQTPTVPVTDVQINGTSILDNGVANIPKAGDSFGVVKVGTTYGVQLYGSGNNQVLGMSVSTDANIKAGAAVYTVTQPSKQHASTFYGLAKAAGDTTQSASSNAVGTYTSQAKAAIQTMLGIEQSVSLVENISETAPVIVGQPNVRYICGEVSEIDITPPNSGSIEIIFESGTTPAVMTVPNTIKWPEWFDTTSLEADTIYRMIITDGIYGAVMSWAS